MFRYISLGMYCTYRIYIFECNNPFKQDIFNEIMEDYSKLAGKRLFFMYVSNELIAQLKRKEGKDFESVVPKGMIARVDDDENDLIVTDIAELLEARLNDEEKNEISLESGFMDVDKVVKKDNIYIAIGPLYSTGLKDHGYASFCLGKPLSEFEHRIGSLVLGK